MSLYKQFKVIFWKNWKLFRQKTFMFLTGGEILVTIMIICTLAIREKQREDFEPMPSTDVFELSRAFALNIKKEDANQLAFVFPKEQVPVSGEEFLNIFKNDPTIKKAIDVKKTNYSELEMPIFSTEAEFEDFSNKDKKNKIIAGIVFNQDFTDYSIRIKGVNIIDSQKNPIGNYGKSRKSEWFDSHSWIEKNRFIYIGATEGDVYNDIFVPLQIALDRTIINIKTGGNVKGFTAEIGKLSKPEVTYLLSEEDNREQSYDGYGPYVAFIFIAQIFHLCNRLMEEKESGTKEGLITIGANRILLWLTWEFIYLPFSILIILLTIFFDPPNFMSAINPILFFFTLLFYAISIYEIVVIFSLIAKKGKTVTMLTCFFLFSLIKVNEWVYDLKIHGNEKIEKIFSLIFSPVGVSMAGCVITYEDNRDNYIGITNLFDTEFGIYFVYLFIDAVVYFIIAVLIDYASGINFKTIGISKSQKEAVSDAVSYVNDIQEDPIGSELFVQVKNIYKFFKFRRNIATDNDSNNAKLGKIFAANRNISFNVYKDEIFAILGHNGAGKSTLIQNMIGMQRPDGGETFYGGLPISKNKKKIHQQLGICLQNNVIINGFTVADHYKLYSGVKNVESDVDEWLRDIDLYEKKDYDVQKLSGGQKRKLCIGLALIGNPKYVFLDEPTTGLDPLSRRKIWSLLLKKKKDRVIFITTHYMDEADIIADRKLILNKGSIRCLGSSVYLKSHFQMKYNLEVETKEPQSVETIIKQYIPEAIYFNNKTKVDDGKYLTASNASSCHIWKLPIDSSSVFSTLLKQLEGEKGKILIDFSLNAPILEELFVNLERENEDEEDSNMAIELPKIDTIKRPNDYITALRLARYRMKLFLRRKLYLLMAIILPFIILIIFFPKLNKMVEELDSSKYKNVPLTPELYKNHQWNYDILGSGMNSTVNAQIMEQEFPKLSNAQSSITYYTQQEMESIGQSVYQEPYYVSSFSGDIEDGIYKFKIQYNDSMPHSLPSTLNGLSNAVLAANHLNDTITVRSYPLSYYSLLSLTLVKYYASMIIAISVAFALSFYGSNIVHEKVANLYKQLQLNGISHKSYWLSLIISDYLWFLVTCAIVVLVIVTIKFTPLYYFNLLVVIISFLALCSLGCILFQYCIGYLFKSDNSAYIFYLLINIIPTFYFTSKTMQIGGENESDEFENLIFYSAIILDALFPNYCFIRVIKNLISIGIEHRTLERSIAFSNLFAKKSQIIPHFIGAFISILFYTGLLVFLTKKIYNPSRKGVFEITETMAREIERKMKDGDDDILHEYKRVVADTNKNEIPIKLVTLTKEYDRLQFNSNTEIREAMERKNPKYGEYHISNVGAQRIVMTAFENMTLGVNKCECFGILGPNGSGKSSLLNTASFTYKQTLGDIIYDGQNTLDRKGNEITLGYCPQEDTLWNEMTLYEHIVMFLYIRGYSRKEAKRLAKLFIKYCRLTPHKNKLPNELSGGTRRKLNILIALCCSSSKVMLDEPSAGMDPSTRRYVWDIIKATIQSNQSSTIMTTHSMEEAELLCNRIGIMVNGKLQCIGSPEHLKMKFGNTYILDVHTNDVERFHNEVVLNQKLFGEGKFKREDKSLQRVKYEVTNTSNISRVFEIMEACRDAHLFEDYSYSQTSLEQVFLNFAALKENQE